MSRWTVAANMDYAYRAGFDYLPGAHDNAKVMSAHHQGSVFMILNGDDVVAEYRNGEKLVRAQPVHSHDLESELVAAIANANIPGIVRVEPISRNRYMTGIVIGMEDGVEWRLIIVGAGT